MTMSPAFGWKVRGIVAIRKAEELFGYRHDLLFRHRENEGGIVSEPATLIDHSPVWG